MAARNKPKIVMRIELGDSSSDSSDEDATPAPETVQKPPQENSEWEEDWHSDEPGTSQAAAVSRTAEENEDSDSSTSSNGREKCPICLLSFGRQEVGKPENCDHKFCATCIEEWSKTVSTCPFDRKQFLKIICLENYHSPTVTREISVKVENKCEEVDAEDDLTFCRICNRSDREESMLLCDGCNLGYHMECLVPALEEVPTEFWYCDDCFASSGDNDSGDELALQEEIAELMDEVRDFGIPESRLRIRTELAPTAPRILRTRQSERIREAILARTNRRGFREATREVPPEDVVAMPGPSRLHTSVRIVRSMNTPGPSRTTQRPTTRRSSAPRTRRRVNRKTVVVEYDVDHEDDKFAIKTKKLYKKIKRRRKKKRKTEPRCTRSTTALQGDEYMNQMSSISRLELCKDVAKDALTLTRSRAGIAPLSITGNRNTVDYFSSDDGDDSGTGGLGGGGGGLMMATRNRTIGSNIRSLRNRKGGLIIPESALPSTTDVLGSIMNEQERWMAISNPRNINQIKINSDGSLAFEGELKPNGRNKTSKPNEDRPPINSVVAAAGVTDTTIRVTSNSSTTRTSEGTTTTGQTNSGGESGPTVTSHGNSNGTGEAQNATTGSSSTGSNDNSAPTTSSYPDLRTAAARKAPPSADLKVLSDKDDGGKKSPADDSSDDDCPNFSVYSAETMQLAKTISNPNEAETSKENDQDQMEEEREEDLVQLDDDELMDLEPREAELANNKKCELELHVDKSDWDELNNERGAATGAENPDEEEDKEKGEGDQLNTESISEDEEAEEVLTNENSRRSLTPCLDEKNPESELDLTASDEKRKTEDLELISDDEMADQNVSKEAKEGDEFKRLSRTTKERNYRDKDRKSQSPKKRDKSPEKKRETHSPSSRSRNRRKDLQRYDVRHVIAERKQRPDKYGRDTTKQKRSQSKSRSSSLSSLSPDEAHRSRSRSRRRRSRSKSRSRSPRRNRRRGSKSPAGEGAAAARRGRSPRRSPVANRKRRSLSRFTMSPSVSRSPSPDPVSRASPRRNVGRRESPTLRNRRPGSPARLKNGRSGRKDEENSLGKRRALSPVVASTSSQRRRRRSRSMSSASSHHSSPTRGKAKARYLDQDPGKSWTPPLRAEDRLLEPSGNFKVVVKNSTTSSSKKEKKAKKKKLDKKRDAPEKSKKEKKNKTKTGSGKSSSGPSKEIFASGDNILVSVNFSSKRSAEGAASSTAQTTIVTLPPSKDQIVTQKQRQEQRERDKVKEREKERDRSKTNKGKRGASPSGRNTTLVVTKNRRHRKVDAKPVAIIDLDGSPFRVMTPSPKAVIVLSDSDGEGGAERKNRKAKKNPVEAAEGAKKRQPESVGQSSKSEGSLLSKRIAGAAAAAAAVAAAASASANTVRVRSEDEDDDDDDMDIDGGHTPTTPPLPVTSSSSNTGGKLTITNSISSMMDNGGPKTPPEPTMKFSMSMRSKTNVLRTANPLHDAREEEEEEQNAQQAEQKQKEESNSIGSSDATRSVIPQATSVVDKEPLAGNNNLSSGNDGESQQLAGGNAPNDPASNNSNAASLSLASTNNNGISGNNKIGPNTPPEPAPTSPDAYDPFEPTKSNSVSPVQDMDLSSSNDVEQPRSTPLKIVNSPRHKDLRSLDEHKGKIPVSDLVMKLLNSTAGHHHHMHHTDRDMVGTLSPPPPPPPYLEKSLERSGDSGVAGKGIQILSNVVIQQGKGVGDALPQGKSLKHTAAYSTMNNTSTSYSIMKQIQTEAKRKQKTPSTVTTATATTCTPTLTQAMLKKHNAECTLMDIAAESPYSPGSSDFDDLFEPPMDATGAPSATSSRIPAVPAPSPMKNKSQAELFDSLFGSHTPPGQKTWTQSKGRKHQSSRGHSSTPRKSSHRKHASIDDDVPDSALDMVLKENYIKKLNRQERVVEEVKIVLRPHFRRKHITKEDYKEIMRKSVSKICNSRSGEINPLKIKAFIDAYVQKYRYRRKHGTGTSGGGGAGATASAASGNAN